MKKIEDFALNNGAEKYHIIWIKYFTIPYKIVKSNDQEMKKIDILIDELSKLSYTPIDSMKKQLSKCKSSQDFTKVLCDIFDLSNKDLINKAILLAEESISLKSKLINYPNYDVIPQLIFKGYISVVSQMYNALSSEFSGNGNPFFTQEEWLNIHFIYDYLMVINSSTSIIKDFIVLLDVIFNSYLKFLPQIISLHQEHYLYDNLLQFVSLMISSITSNLTATSSSIYLFLDSLFGFWLNTASSIDINDKIYANYEIYIQFLKVILPNLPKKLFSSISQNITKFLLLYKYGEHNEPFSIGLTSLDILSKMIDEIDDNICSEVCNILFKFSLHYISTNYNKEEETVDNNTMDVHNNLHFFQPDEYFSTNSYVNSSIIDEAFSNAKIQELVIIYRNFFSSKENYKILCHILSNSIFPNDELRFIFFLLVIKSIAQIKDFPHHNISMIIDSFISKNIFTFPTTSIHQTLIKNIYSFLVKFSKLDSSLFRFTLNKLAEICSKDFGKVSLFMPLLRSFLFLEFSKRGEYHDLYENSQFSFITEFSKAENVINVIQSILKTENFEKEQDEIVIFLQVFSSTFIFESFSSFSLLPIFLQIVTIERYRTIFLQCFHNALKPSSYYESQVHEVISGIISLITVLFQQNVADSTLTPLLNNFIHILVDVIYDYSEELLIKLSNNNFYISISTLPQTTKEIQTMKDVLSIFFLSVKKYPKLISLIDSRNSLIFSNLNNSLQMFKTQQQASSENQVIDEELVEILFSFVMNKKVNINFMTLPMIQNRAPLQLLLDATRDTNFEEQILEDLYVLCNGSTSNAFECFKINIIKYTLERASVEWAKNDNQNKNICFKCISLFESVASHFFSPLSLNDTFKVLYYSSEQQRSELQQIILDCLLRLLVEDKPNPVRSFFHFNGYNTGIFGPQIFFDFFNCKWAFITTLRLDISKTDEDPVLLIKDDKSGYKLSLSFVNNQLIFSKSFENTNFSSSFENIKFSKHIWYQILVLYSRKEVQLYLNGEKVSSIPIKSKKFEVSKNKEFSILIGSNQNRTFSGDLGSILFYSLNDHDSYTAEKMIKKYQKSETTHSRSSSLLFYDPCNVDENIINDVTSNGSSANLLGNAVQFCTTLSSVVKYNGTFQRFLPLFYHVDKPKFENDAGVDDQLFHTLLVILRVLLGISKDMEKMFESIGGFQLLTGIFTSIQDFAFTNFVPNDLFEIYSSLKKASLKKQMVEYLWLNFDLWSKMPYQLEILFYKHALENAYMHNPKLFKLSSYDFLLFQVQSIISLQSNSDVPNAQAPKSLYNKFMTLEEMNDIKSLQWNFYSKLILKNPSQSSIMFLFMILTFHNNLTFRKYALDIFDRILSTENFGMLLTLRLLNGIDGFTSCLETDHPQYSLHCIYRVAKIQQLQKENHSTIESYFDLQKLILAATAIIRFESVESKQLFNNCIKYVFNYAEKIEDSNDFYDNYKNNDIMNISDQKGLTFNCPEFIPLLCLLSLYIDDNSAHQAYKIFLSAIENDFEKIDLFINDVECWEFYLLALSNRADNAVDIFSEIISRNINNRGLHNQNTEILRKFINFFLFIHITVKTELNILSLLARFFIQLLEKINNFELTNIVFQTILFTPTIDEQRSICNDKCNFSLEEIFLMKKALENMKIPNITFNFQPFFKNSLYKILEEQALLRKEFNFSPSFFMNGFCLYSLLVSIQIININLNSKEDRSQKIEEILEKFNKQKELYSYNLSETDIELSNILINYALIEQNAYFGPANEKEIIIEKYNSFKEKADTYAKKLDLKPFIDDLSKIASLMQEGENFASRLPKQTNEQYMNSFLECSLSHQSSRLGVENYNLKLSQSFIREQTLNGGPLSISPPTNVKWRWSNRVDLCFRPNKYRINRYFNDHMRESSIRDSIPFVENFNPNQLAPFKRILDENISFMPTSTPNKQKFLGTFHSINITINAQYVGNLSINKTEFFFEGKCLMDGFGSPLKSDSKLFQKLKFIQIPFFSVGFIFMRSHLYNEVAIEIFTHINKSYLFVFDSKEFRNEFINIVRKKVDTQYPILGYSSLSPKIKSPENLIKKTNVFKQRFGKLKELNNKKFDFLAHCRKACNSYVQNISSSELLIKSDLVKAWQENAISNFEYLFSLNLLAGRSLNDLSKYPVFPWIFSDYTSETINLNDPNIYRRLDLPLGALNEERLETIKIFLKEVDDPTELCLYRTHYSNAACVIGYLIRTEPFTSMHIILQDGKFDHADRIFHSIESAWRSVSSQLNDYRELIPQFYCDPHFLINENHFDFGKTMNNENVDDVDLPKWADNSAYKFIEIQRAGLESQYVSEHINEWIDLIFGIYQRSDEKNNVYHMFSYSDCLQSPYAKDPQMEKIARYHGANFGTCCDKLFSQKHPVRRPAKNLQQKSIETFLNMININDPVMKFVHYFKNNCMITFNNEFIDFSEQKIIKLPCELHERKAYSIINACREYSLIFLVPRGGNFMSVISFNKDGRVGEIKRVSHESSSILCLDIISCRYVITGGSDCSIHIWSLPSMELLSRLSIQSLPVSEISGVEELDLVVSIDKNDQVWCASIEEQKFLHTFQIECNKGSAHKLLVTANGFIAVSSNIINETSYIDIYDLRGNLMKKIETAVPVVNMQTVNTMDSKTFIIASLENYKIIVISIKDFEIFKEFSRFDPNFFSVDGSSREILSISKDQSKIVRLTF